jgi:hypothetical protein
LDNLREELENVPEKNSDIYINRKKEEIAKIEKEIQSIENNISSHRDSLQEKFSKFIPHKYDDNGSTDTSPMESLKKGGKDNRGNTVNVTFFQEKDIEELPEVGVIKNLRGSRYLEIEYWEEVQKAKEEAIRLKAQISVKKEG